MRDLLTRRTILAGSGASLLCTVLGPFPARAAEMLAMPATIRSRLLALEGDAARANLMKTHRAPLPVLGPSNVYLASLPRLVELVDAATLADPGLAERAALLLSIVNLQERLSTDSQASTMILRAPPPPFQSVKPEYERLFDTLTVRPEHVGRVKWYVDRLVRNRPRYEAVAADTGVPWHFIGTTHALEASLNFLAHLHNGDVPLSQVTRQVPAGRPKPWEPPFTWERSAKDVFDFKHLSNLKDWSLARTLYRLEAYNGFGYRGRNVPTPYLWSFSNQYKSGKYVKDGKWSATAVSQQCGAAVMIHELVRRGELKLG